MSFFKKYLSRIFREAQKSLWEISGVCLEMFGESVKFKFRTQQIFFMKIFLRAPSQRVFHAETWLTVYRVKDS
jgi:hypothetical protein